MYSLRARPRSLLLELLLLLLLLLVFPLLPDSSLFASPALEDARTTLAVSCTRLREQLASELAFAIGRRVCVSAQRLLHTKNGNLACQNERDESHRSRDTLARISLCSFRLCTASAGGSANRGIKPLPAQDELVCTTLCRSSSGSELQMNRVAIERR